MNIRQILLLEAADVSSGEKILKALEKGMVPGVKKKLIAPKDVDEKSVINALDRVAKAVKEATEPQNYNKFLFLVLKKLRDFKTIRNAVLKRDDFNDWLDSIHSYFNNLNKQEVRNDPETKKKFDEFASSPFNLEKDKEFERWANEKFAGKAKVKDESKEMNKIYDKGGWEIIIPKTFAAASKLACMADRKAHWCTSASPSMFKSYTEGDNKLYIIRNDAKDIMYQMDWGIGPDGSYYPNFKDEMDRGAKAGDVVKKIPAEVLDALKNPKTGKSIKDIYDEAKKKEEKPKKDEPKPIEGEENWTVRRLTPDEAKEALKGVKFSFGSKKTDELSLEKLMSGRTGDSRDINYIEEITNGKKYYYYVDGMVRRGPYAIGGREYANSIFEKRGDKLVAKTAQGLARLKNFPESIKKKLFKPSDLPIGEKGKKDEEIKPYKEVGGAKFYKFKNINQIFDLAGKPSLGERIKLEMSRDGQNNEHLAYFQKGGIHYIFGIERNRPEILRYDLNTNYSRRSGSDFQEVAFIRWAFLNKELAKHLLEMALRNPKLKNKELWKKAMELIDKEKIEIKENGKTLVLQKSSMSHGKPLEITSPDFDDSWSFGPVASGDGIEARKYVPGNNERVTFTSPQAKELDRIYTLVGRY